MYPVVWGYWAIGGEVGLLINVLCCTCSWLMIWLVRLIGLLITNVLCVGWGLYVVLGGGVLVLVGGNGKKDLEVTRTFANFTL
jgi:hypothetical protein